MGKLLQAMEKPVVSSNFRWTVVAMAFAITAISYLDRSAISYAIAPIKQEFGLSNQDFGFIASAFGLGYMLMTVIGGVMVDKWGARRIWTGSAILWSAVTVLTGAANCFALLFGLRAALGLAEGPCFPSLSRTVADWLPKSEKSRATAWCLSAVPLASVIGAPLISNLIVHLGWKLMFAVLGSLGFVWSAVWLYFFRDCPEASRFVSPGELRRIKGDGKETRRPDPEKTAWTFMLFNPSLLSNNYAFFAFGYTLFFALTWLPGYLESAYGLHLGQVGIFLIAPWLSAAVLLTAAGYLSDWLWMKTGSLRKSRSHLIWICQLASAACFLPVAFIHSLPAAITLISLGVGLSLMPNAAFYALNSDLSEGRVGTSLGIMDCFFAAAGIAAPAITGMIVQATGSFHSAFLLLGGITLTSVAGIVLFQRSGA